MVVATAFLIGLAVVDDKEYGTILAIRASPVNSTEYFVGRSIFPFLVTLFYTFAALVVLGLTHVNTLQVYLVVIVAFSVTPLCGLLIGALGNNQVEAIGIGKILSVVLMLAILGSTMLPDEWHWVVWWSPLYWIYDALEKVFTETAAWGSLAIDMAAAFCLTAAYFVLLRKRIVKGLA